MARRNSTASTGVHKEKHLQNDAFRAMIAVLGRAIPHARCQDGQARRKPLSPYWVIKQRSDHNARTATRLRVEASAMDASCSEGPVTSRNKLALTVMDLPQTENVHNTALGAHWARVTRSNLILTTSNRRHACATLTVARPWAHGPVLRAAALAEAIFVTRGRAPSGPGATPVRTREHGDQSARESLV